MFQTIKKIIKILVVIKCGFIILVLIPSIYVYKNDIIAKDIKDKGNASFFVLIYGTDKMFPERFDAYTMLYDKSTNMFKILSVNTEAVVFKKKEKARSLKTRFNENAKKDLDNALKVFYSDLHEILGTTADFDFYININFETLDIMMRHNKKLKLTLSQDNFENKDLESLNRLEMMEQILHLIPHKILNIYKNYKLLDTNIPKLSLLSSAVRLKFLKPAIMFCELPVKYTKMRVEPDKQNIEEFLDKIYRVNVSSQISTRDLLIDVKNASKKLRMAEKATWLLRKNKFDVLDWGTFPISYDKTLIKDCKGNFEQSLRIAEVLKAGKVIVSYNNKIYSDISIFVGRDCMIYDNLDKKGDRNGKN
ncbi:MAG: LytR C-terminal domain-containing protein [Endomicrobium sp.]|nr:LytR C-terminal domain-containing protein [Endomicrobium sp.]